MSTRATTGALLAIVGLSVSAASPSGPSFAQRFTDPPPETRILKIIHNWPDNSAQQDALIQMLQRQGFGGVVCNVSFQGYLQDETRWQTFERAVKHAHAARMAMWLYDERGYPSGNAGGLVLKDHPEWEARGLLVADAETSGGPCSLELPPGRWLVCAAFPVVESRLDPARRFDLSDRIHDRKLRWEAPAGHWRLLAITEDRLYDGTHADMNLAEKMPYVNLLQAEPTAKFLDLTHAQYARRLGPDLGQFFQATFTDEPSLMSLFLKRMPWRPLPWSAQLPAEFLQRRGYELEPILVSLVADAGPETARHRHDFWRTIGELVSENFFGQIQEWCRRHRIPSGGHLLAEEGLTGHVALYGDFFRCLRRMDAPSIDCLTSVPAEVPWHIARLAASAAEIEGQPLVMCETSDHGQVYRPAGDQRPKRIVTEAEIRGTCNRLFVSGVNTITSYYSFTGLSDEALLRLNQWVGRCGFLLRGGHQVADVAVVYPAESLWTHFVPAHHWATESPGANRIDAWYRGALESLFEARRDLIVIDSQTILEAQVTDGALVRGPHRWRVVVLPGVDTLPRAAWRKLDRFVRSGGILVALGTRPLNSETEFPCPEVQQLSRRWFPEANPAKVPQPARGRGVSRFLAPGSEALLSLLIDSLLEADVAVADPALPLRSTHRRVDGHDVYFVINDSPRPCRTTLTLRGTGTGERLDPATGRIAALPNTGPIDVELEPYAATAFRYPSAQMPARKTPTPGALPGLELRPLPHAPPHVARGEFVREQFERVALPEVAGRDVWAAQATLTKGEVDTFLFVRFAYPETVDLSQARALELESWVPEGQRTGTQLLVIVHEKDGGDFFAATARTLNSAGYEQSLVLLNRLQLAGWSQDSDGLLDLRRVEEIRVGWGGYYGREREEVTFRLTAPRAAVAR